MKKNQGFTLIELIIVIVVLGILAVTAAPQFIDFSSDARTSSVKGLKGALQGAVQTTKGRASIDGFNAASGESLASGVTLVYGYPAPTVDGIINAAGLSAYDGTAANFAGQDWIYTTGVTDIDNDGNDEDAIFIAPANNFNTDNDITLSQGDSCQVEYTSAQGESTPPIITVEQSC